MNQDLSFTGERFVPGDPKAQGEMWIEHWHRYHFVAPIVAGCRVLDIACGEGYGSALMARCASQVTGADVSPAAIAHARGHYAGVDNLTYVEASCERLPFPDASFDIVVSFETLEHILPQAAFFAEVRRVLAPDGLFIVSTPDRAEYSDKRGYANAFHVKELYRAEFAGLLAAQFSHCRWLAQRNAFVSLIAEAAPGAQGDWLTVSEAAPESPRESLPALYHLVLATNAESARWPIPARLSVFTDAEEWAYNDYRATYQACQHLLRRERELTEQVAALEKRLAESAAPAAAAPMVSAAGESGLAKWIKKLST